MKRPIIDQYDRQYMRHYTEYPAWERFDRLKACKEAKYAIGEELGIFKLLNWLSKNIKGKA